MWAKQRARCLWNERDLFCSAYYLDGALHLYVCVYDDNREIMQRQMTWHIANSLKILRRFISSNMGCDLNMHVTCTLLNTVFTNQLVAPSGVHGIKLKYSLPKFRK